MLNEQEQWEEWLKSRPGMEDRLMQSIVDEIAKECYRWNKESDYHQLCYKISKFIDEMMVLGHNGAEYFVENKIITNDEEITEMQ